MKLLVLVLYYMWSMSFALEFPSYIPKCSLSSSNLEECQVENANIAIPQLVEGDDALQIPVMSPVHIPEATLEGKALKVTISNAYGYGLDVFRLSEAICDMKDNKCSFKATVDKFYLLGKYSIDNSKLLSFSVFGEGNLNMTLIHNKVQYHCDIVTYEKGGDVYAKTVNRTFNFTPERAHFRFENLHSLTKVDTNALIDKNWKLIWDELKPSTEGYLLQYFSLVSDAFLDNFPLNEIYLP